jgi:hypothetical protein
MPELLAVCVGLFADAIHLRAIFSQTRIACLQMRVRNLISDIFKGRSFALIDKRMIGNNFPRSIFGCVGRLTGIMRRNALLNIRS